MSSEELTAFIWTSNNLTSPEKAIIKVLLKYKGHLTAKPGKCIVFDYEFKLSE
jgi:hypothetical protein